MEYASAFDDVLDTPNGTSASPEDLPSPLAEVPPTSPVEASPTETASPPIPEGCLEQMPVEEAIEQLAMPTETENTEIKSGCSPNKNKSSDTFYFYQGKYKIV